LFDVTIAPLLSLKKLLRVRRLDPQGQASLPKPLGVRPGGLFRLVEFLTRTDPSSLMIQSGGRRSDRSIQLLPKQSLHIGCKGNWLMTSGEVEILKILMKGF